jgi:hypothetical protein
VRKETTMLVKGGTYARHFGKVLSFVSHQYIYRGDGRSRRLRVCSQARG